MRIRRIADAPRGIQWMRIAYEVDGRPDGLRTSAGQGDRRLKIEPEGGDAAPRTVTSRRRRWPS